MATSSLLLTFTSVFLYDVTSGFIPGIVTPSRIGRRSFGTMSNGCESSRKTKSLAPSRIVCHSRGNDHGDDFLPSDSEENVDEIDLNEEDWRTFRAKLVMAYDTPVGSKEKESKSPTRNNDIISSTKASSTLGNAFLPNSDLGDVIYEDEDVDGIGQLFFDEEEAQKHFSIIQNGDHWAYDSGNVIETGAVILGGVEQDFGFGLRQQYFHKAAILVLDHDEGKFTKGIILNRPSDRVLSDPENPNVKWRVWFGGDVQGLDSFLPEIVCLHSLTDDHAERVSTQVMKDIKYCSFDDAKDLVRMGKARVEDFWVFSGYAGWAPGQLMGELERSSWYMVATDSQTLLEEMARQSANADPRDAGLDTWELLMQMIGRGETAKDTVGDFEDLMLKEWARRHLLQENINKANGRGGGGLLSKKNGNSGNSQNSSGGKDLIGLSAVDKLLRKAAGFARDDEVRVGSLIRASSAKRSPFLLDKQEFHKSVVLVISDDDNISVGVILNRPSSKGLDVQIVDKASGVRKTVSVPLRYGGEYAVKGQAPLLWLHCSERLRSTKVGHPLASNQSGGIWSCTPDEASTAMSHGLASPNDFMVISGVSVWTKGERGRSRGIQGEVQLGNFEVVQSKATPAVFNKLLTQDLLTGVNLFRLLSISNEAWRLAGDHNGDRSKDEDEGRPQPMNGHGKKDDESLIFRSNVRVNHLADDALKTWISTFLLGVPSLR